MDFITKNLWPAGKSWQFFLLSIFGLPTGTYGIGLLGFSVLNTQKFPSWRPKRSPSSAIRRTQKIYFSCAGICPTLPAAFDGWVAWPRPTPNFSANKRSELYDFSNVIFVYYF
jgi:hypothetical protein